MIKPFSTFYAIVSVVAFLVLATIAAVEYSGQEDTAAGVKGDAVYRVVKSSVEKAETLWANTPTTTPEISTTTVAEPNNRFLSRLHDYVIWEKTDAGWQLTLQNSDHIIFQKVIILK